MRKCIYKNDVIRIYIEEARSTDVLSKKISSHKKTVKKTIKRPVKSR